jgi:hypothetical protein
MTNDTTPPPLAVKNRFTHDRDGHPYTFNVDAAGRLTVNGAGGELWLGMAQGAIKGVMEGRSGCSLEAAISYIDKGIAVLANTPDTRKQT